MSRKIVVSSVSRRTMKGSDSVVVIGVRRHEASGDNSAHQGHPRLYAGTRAKVEARAGPRKDDANR
jgi:hypothetical protein